MLAPSKEFPMKLLVLLLLVSCSSFAAQPKKILMVINEGFQVDEYFVPRKIFEEAGHSITVASRFGGEVHPGRKYTDYSPVQADINFTQIDVNDYDAITFTGGGGAWSDYFPDKTLHQVLIKAMKREEMVVGLICAATGLLATAGNLDGKTPQFKGRHVTGYGDVAGLLIKQGELDYEAVEVKVDDRLVTGRDPKAAELFGKTVLGKL
jgi:protease I